ncbi:MAG: hypothetical protein GXP49_12805 [Deltaproteobacteria bacterium]|nr:hypothetical protein [Deltaproteobacteria bacterium]
MQDRRQGTRRLILYIGIALVIHAAFLPWAGYLLPRIEGAGPFSEVETLALSRKQWKENREIKSTSIASTKVLQRQKVKKEKKDNEEQGLHGQVVDIQKPAKEEEPEESKYVSEYASRVEKETKSRYRKKDYQNATEKPSRTKQEVKEAMRLNSGGDNNRIVLGARQEHKKKGLQEEKKRLLIPMQEQRSALDIENKENGELANRTPSERLEGNNRNKLQISPNLFEKPNPEGKGGVDRDNMPKLADLMPDLEVLDHIRGDPANDYLPDVDEDEATRLNTRKSYLAAYINRVKRTVSQFWRPRAALYKAVRNREILSPRDYVTELYVELNPDGSLHKLSLTNGSGIDEFDQAGLSAFEEAGSFPNPPPKIKGPDGMIRFNFSFALLLAGASRPLFQLTLSPAAEGWLNPYRRGLLPPR